jgi:hypothetical protein
LLTSAHAWNRLNDESLIVEVLLLQRCEQIGAAGHTTTETVTNPYGHSRMIGHFFNDCEVVIEGCGFIDFNVC